LRPLLVGEANPYGGDPEFALYPSPPGCAGHRLCRLVMQLDPDDYLERFDRANLCARAWKMTEARARAAELATEYVDVPVVLLGAKVCRAFEVAFDPFSFVDAVNRVWRTDASGAPEAPIERTPQYVILPHPSGLSRLWNAPGAYDRARAALRAAGVLPP
jgi:hypothetical protein